MSWLSNANRRTDMAKRKLNSIDVPGLDCAETEARSDKLSILLFWPLPGWYAAILVTVALGACAYSLRKDGAFSCSASGYRRDNYLSYCNSTSLGDYDHCAFWFALERKRQLPQLMPGLSFSEIAVPSSPFPAKRPRTISHRHTKNTTSSVSRAMRTILSKRPFYANFTQGQRFT